MKSWLEDAIRMYEETHSVNKTAAAFGVEHHKMSKMLKSQGVTVLSRRDAAKYTWKNNVHPRLGKKGKDCPQYGHKMTEETKRKMRPIWDAIGDARRYERKKHNDGYILVYAPDNPNSDNRGFILEHRLVMESIIGRPCPVKNMFTTSMVTNLTTGQRICSSQICVITQEFIWK